MYSTDHCSFFFGLFTEDAGTRDSCHVPATMEGWASRVGRCVRERGRETERECVCEREGERERVKERERVCVCVCERE